MSIRKNTDIRISESERFPRIRDAKIFMEEAKENNDAKVRRKKRKKPRSLKSDSGSIEFFTSYRVNKDSSCSKYMPFDEVHYPKVESVHQSLDLPTESISNIWMSGFIDDAHLNQIKKSKVFLKSLTEMPDSSLLPQIAEKMRTNSGGGFSSSRYPSIGSIEQGKGLTVDEEFRLKALAKRVTKKKSNSIESNYSGIQPYLDANLRLSNARKALKPIKRQFASDALEKVFDIEVREHHAAVTIQRMWRRPIPLRKLRFTVLCMLMAVRIQRVVRGIIARKWVASWMFLRNKFTPLWQSRIRRWLSNTRWSRQLEQMHRSCTLIQKTIRGKLGRNRFFLKKYTLAAVQIQRVWRGAVGRVRADRRWLSGVVSIIQRNVRKRIGKKKYYEEKAILSRAAVLIQSCFRSWRAFRTIKNRLFARESNYREDIVAMLTAEEEYFDDKISKQAERLAQKEIRARLIRAAEKVQGKFGEIFERERDLAETTRQLNALTPRAVQQGWKKEQIVAARKLRAECTQMKLDCLFGDEPAMVRLETVFQRKVEELEATAREQRRVSDSRERVRTWVGDGEEARSVSS